jgi:hypothetical protein
MKRNTIAFASVLTLVITLCALIVTAPTQTYAASRTINGSACSFPTSVAATTEETAWQLFVAANCPSNAGHVVWEDWAEQLDVYPASAKDKLALNGRRLLRRLHASPLALDRQARSNHLLAPSLQTTACNQMQGPPANVVKDATVCEEVKLNPDAQQFVVKKGYSLRTGQVTDAQNNVDIEFPNSAIEVKVDWIPATDFSVAFTCDKPPSGIHVELINGACYAMAGIHITSKLVNNWIWATFEPQSMLTNPLRCITFGNCFDKWGSTPAASAGGQQGFTRQSAALRDLMSRAHLALEFYNYRLDGVQFDFLNPDHSPSYLGNSIIEGENVGLKHNQASCITCHSVSSIKTDGTDGNNVLINLPDPPTGPRYRYPASWIARDFVWSLGLACPDNTQTGLQPCISSRERTTKSNGR